MEDLIKELEKIAKDSKYFAGCYMMDVIIDKDLSKEVLIGIIIKLMNMLNKERIQHQQHQQQLDVR